MPERSAGREPKPLPLGERIKSLPSYWKQGEDLDTRGLFATAGSILKDIDNLPKNKFSNDERARLAKGMRAFGLREKVRKDLGAELLNSGTEAGREKFLTYSGLADAFGLAEDPAIRLLIDGIKDKFEKEAGVSPAPPVTVITPRPVSQPVPVPPGPGAGAPAGESEARPLDDDGADQPDAALRDQLRSEMARIFGDEIYERDIQKYLNTARYNLRHLPGYRPASTIWEYAEAMGESLSDSGRSEAAAASFRVAMEEYAKKPGAFPDKSAFLAKRFIEENNSYLDSAGPAEQKIDWLEKNQEQIRQARSAMEVYRDMGVSTSAYHALQAGMADADRLLVVARDRVIAPSAGPARDELGQDLAILSDEEYAETERHDIKSAILEQVNDDDPDYAAIRADVMNADIEVDPSIRPADQYTYHQIIITGVYKLGRHFLTEDQRPKTAAAALRSSFREYADTEDHDQSILVNYADGYIRANRAYQFASPDQANPWLIQNREDLSRAKQIAEEYMGALSDGSPFKVYLSETVWYGGELLGVIEKAQAKPDGSISGGPDAGAGPAGFPPEVEQAIAELVPIMATSDRALIEAQGDPIIKRLAALNFDPQAISAEVARRVEEMKQVAGRFSEEQMNTHNQTRAQLTDAVKELVDGGSDAEVLEAENKDFSDTDFEPAVNLWDYANRVGLQLHRNGKFKQAAACFAVAMRQYEQNTPSPDLDQLRKFAGNFINANWSYSQDLDWNSQQAVEQLQSWFLKNTDNLNSARQVMERFRDSQPKDQQARFEQVIGFGEEMVDWARNFGKEEGNREKPAPETMELVRRLMEEEPDKYKDEESAIAEIRRRMAEQQSQGQ